MRQQPFASPEEALAHFGVRGMKWGVRKQRPPSDLQGLITKPITMTTANGDKFTLSPMKVTKLHKGMAKLSKKYRENYKNSTVLDIKDKDGKTIGNGQMWLRGKNKEELYLNWVSVDKSVRGKGYASAVLQAGEAKGRELGAKKMTLEVPGNAPDARHIYEKMGFKVTHEDIDPSDPVWGGLTSMEKRLD